MKVLARFVLVLLGLLLIGTGLYILAVSADLDIAGGVALAGLADKPVLAAVGAGFLLVGLILISLGFRSPNKTPETVLQVSEFGEIRIAITAIENMVLRIIQQNKGVRDISRRVTSTPQGLMIYMRIRAVPDLQLPGLISELQGKVKSYIEEITGMFVLEVKVMVENIVLDQVPAKVK